MARRHRGPDGSAITPVEFEQSLDNDVTLAFPEGLTCLRSHLLILLYPGSNRQADRDIEKIRSDYRTEFARTAWSTSRFCAPSRPGVRISGCAG